MRTDFNIRVSELLDRADEKNAQRDRRFWRFLCADWIRRMVEARTTAQARKCANGYALALDQYHKATVAAMRIRNYGHND